MANEKSTLGGNSAADSDDEILEALEKKSALSDIKSLQVIRQALMSHEMRRLAKKLGGTHPRVQHLKEALDRNPRYVNAISVENEKARIKVPAFEENGALIHGRISDENNRGISGLIVTMEDEKDQKLRFLGPAKTDASGYHAFVIDAENLKKLSRLDGVYLTVATPKGRIVYQSPAAIKATAGGRIVVNVALRRFDLSPITEKDKAVQDRMDSAAVEPDEPAPTGDTWIIKGRVKDASGNSVAGVTVSVFDKDLFFDDRLGTAVTDENGNYQLIYHTKDFRDLIESNPDLYVEVRDKEGRKFYSSGKPIRFEAGRKEVFNVKIRKKTG